MELTERERELFVNLVRKEMEWRRSNPDVGIGPTYQTVASIVARSLTFEIPDDEIEFAAKIAQYMDRTKR